jgi:hypothetical protein
LRQQETGYWSYQNALEFAVDLSLGWPTQLTLGETYQTIPLRILPQQEAISYLDDGRSFIYSSEVRPPFNEAELIRVSCLD